jgi:hypothetical protein
MADYLCYFLNAARHIIGIENLSECQDDVEARERAIKLLQERPQYHGIAVWELNRKLFEEMVEHRR